MPLGKVEGVGGGATPGPPRMSPVNPSPMKPGTRGGGEWGNVHVADNDHGQRDLQQNQRGHSEHYNDDFRNRATNPDGPRSRTNPAGTPACRRFPAGVYRLPTDNSGGHHVSVYVHCGAVPAEFPLMPLTSTTPLTSSSSRQLPKPFPHFLRPIGGFRGPFPRGLLWGLGGGGCRVRPLLAEGSR